ncbi:RagB/SusD family nutrient uptake outer membrane protein [Flavobacteriaceae bacterium Ap0902]|nr:RagB/SusD family nutrient uptake outer membrane protein [Flavobacteriaceae bacterium Ap0902]
MKFKNLKIYALATIIALGTSSCLDDLDQTPLDPDATTELDVFANEQEAKGALSKLYAALALTGQQGPAGNPDIGGIDEGTSQFTRMHYTHQVLTTDEAVVGWGDPGLPDFHAMSWGANNDFTTGLWFRLAQEVSFTNAFINNASQLESEEASNYIAEARFLRAYAYSVLLDIYGSVPIVTEISSDLPMQSSRVDVFNHVEAELLDLVDNLKEPGTNEYGRVDKVAAWALLSRLYLNAEVYTGTARYTDAAEYAEMAINSTYQINMNDANNNGTAYDELFLADNDTNGAQNEFIFPLRFDGLESRTYGGPAFLIHGATGGDMDPASLGINGGWDGLRTTKALVEKFQASAFDSEGAPTAWSDRRAMFYTDGHSYEINTIPNAFTDGYAVIKFSNLTSNGNPGKDVEFPDTDLALIRLAEVHLNYAEAVLRGGGGDTGTAVNLINQLRTRAYGDNSGNINASNLTLDFILDERARELYWEGFRRTDLIRYGRFTTGNYLWPFKGNIPTGTAVPSYRRLFPIPIDAMEANSNYIQNPGY